MILFQGGPLRLTLRRTASRSACMLNVSSWKVVDSGVGGLSLTDEKKHETMQEATRDLPEGAYTSLRTYGKTGFLQLDGHFDRMEETTKLLGHPVSMDRAGYRRLLGETSRSLADHETLFRFTIGVQDRPGEQWISTQPLKTPSAEDYERGVFALTRRKHRENPTAKNNAFIESSKEERKLIGGRINEVLMIGDDNRALEGLSSNFFGIKGEAVYTADDGVLPGITRSLVLDCLADPSIGVDLHLKALEADELGSLDEAFVSSTSRGVLPVVRIDDRDVGGGAPGPVTRRIAAAFQKHVESQLEHL